MTLPYRKRVEYRIPCDEPSRWVVSFRRDGDKVELGLHFGDKDHPAHTLTLALQDFAQLVQELNAK